MEKNGAGSELCQYIFYKRKLSKFAAGYVSARTRPITFDFAAKHPVGHPVVTMKIARLFALVVCLTALACHPARGQDTNKIVIGVTTTLPSGKQIKVVRIVPMHFSNGGDALILNCETDLSMDDKTALRKEADEVWAMFRKNVEQAKMTKGVIRFTHPKGTGPITQSKGYGFVFEKRADGQWHCLQDEKK